MLINAANMAGLNTSFRTSFNRGMGSVESTYEQIATVVPSTTSENAYPWLGDMPGIREWIGEREIHKLEQHGYALRNKTFEDTISVERESVEDDQYGVYSPLFQMFGEEVGVFRDSLVYQMLLDGFINKCYDGQYFFDTDHPGYDKDGKEISVSNMQAGSSAPWFVMDTRRALKPLIFQNRREFGFVAKDKVTDDNVFDKNQFVYGTDGRCNAGYGFWQMAFGSKAALDDTNLNAALTAIATIKKRSGRPAGLKANLLVVGPSNRDKANKLVKAALINGGDTNTNQNVVEVLEVPWLD